MRQETIVNLWFSDVLKDVQNKINSEKCRNKKHWLEQNLQECKIVLNDEFNEYRYAHDDEIYNELIDVIAASLMLADKIKRGK